jgi:anoctamin-10
MSSSKAVSASEKSPSNDSSDPQVDFALVFQGVPAKYLKTKEKVPESIQSKITAEYEKLLEKINSVGLQTSTREGRYGSGQVLIFVRIPDAVLIHSGKEESLSDYLHNVQSSLEPSTTSSLSRSSSMGKSAVHSQAEAFSSAERVRHTYDLLTRPSPKGAGILVKSSTYPTLMDMTPVHDPEYNKTWLHRWSKFSSVLRINSKE